MGMIKGIWGTECELSDRFSTQGAGVGDFLGKRD